jgi:hypothetical protein
MEERRHKLDWLEGMVSQLQEELAVNQEQEKIDQAERWQLLEDRLDSIQEQLAKMRSD